MSSAKLRPDTKILDLPDLEAVDLFEFIFRRWNLCHAEVVIYQCEEKPHFAEAKKKDYRAKRSVAEALQHTPDFSEPYINLQTPDDFAKVREKMRSLQLLDPDKVSIASYLGDKKKDVLVHEALKVVSKVRTIDGYRHIPLLDLDIPVEEGGPAAIQEVANELGLTAGAILNSGRSYHLWGLDLITEEAWRSFMYRALLLDRIDRRWVGHRLLDGQANLRISEKRGKVPKVVHVF